MINFKFVDGVFIELMELLTNSLRSRKRLRIFVLIASLVLLVGIVIAILFYREYFEDYQVAIGIFASIFLAIILIPASILAFSKNPIDFKNPFDVELEKLSVEREKLKEKVQDKDSEVENNVFNTIQLNLNQTTEYYTINKSQARQSFRASMIAIIAGLITILIGIWFMYFKGNVTASTISIVSSVLLEVIGGMYFYVYKKSLEQLNFFYEKLEKTQDTMVAIELTNSINDEARKIELQEKIIVNLIERSSNAK